METKNLKPQPTKGIDVVTGQEVTHWECGGGEGADAFIAEHFPTAYLHGKVPGVWKVPGQGKLHYSIGRVTFIPNARVARQS